MKTVHGVGKKIVECELCGKRQATKARLNHHMKSVHKESGELVERTFTCDNCGKRFVNQENLGVHNRAVHKKYEHFLFYTICNKKFLTRIQLQTHTSKLHKTGIRMMLFSYISPTSFDLCDPFQDFVIDVPYSVRCVSTI